MEILMLFLLCLVVFVLYLKIRFLIIVPNALSDIAKALKNKVSLDEDGSDDD